MSITTLPLSLIALPISIVFITNSWIVIWLLIEINMTGIAMILIMENTNENTVLFFLFQSFPSIIILVVVLINWTPFGEDTNPATIVAIVLAMICNMGIFPLQTWVIKLSNSISWINNLIIITVQKVIPLAILINTYLTIMVPILAIASIIVIIILLINSANINIFIIASSITHISWIMISVNNLSTLCLIYLMIYSLIIIPIVMFINNHNIDSLTQQESNATLNQISFNINIISLSGLPPLTGFFLNALVVYFLVLFNTASNIIIILLIAATGAFYAYSQLIVNILTINSHENNENNTFTLNGTNEIMAYNMILPIVILIN